MKIACASGKGGTGKTTISINLALSIARIQGAPSITYCDCDVEEPNGHIFLRPYITHREEVHVPVPEVDESKCTGCGTCSKTCRYHAIMATKRSVLIFPELCHGCGGCWLLCPEGAITESSRIVGVMESGSVDGGNIGFCHGMLRIGEPQAVPLIRKLKGGLPDGGVVIIDAPPGTSCPVIESVRGVDFVLLVTEPTPFGLYDLGLAVNMVRAMRIPFAVAVNRAGLGGDATIEHYCTSEGIEILMSLPHDRRIAEVYSNGGIIISALPEYQKSFETLWERVRGKGEPRNR